jgi:hypothetical protein
MLFVHVNQFAILHVVWHERSGIRGKAQIKNFNFLRRWEQKGGFAKLWFRNDEVASFLPM